MKFSKTSEEETWSMLQTDKSQESRCQISIFLKTLFLLPHLIFKLKKVPEQALIWTTHQRAQESYAAFESVL